ncbi:MAG: phosphate/phosphite/phosphonate ABC transporter substrate-binding protein [Desulfobulbaceae bacterium]|nr:phosphate/phosphite/phosphonate ABC transporter substrate-binding protein [Desulfobulbaceae bacterium]
MRKIFLLVLFVFFMLPHASSSRAADGLTLWIHPYLPATELIERFSPLAKYLSEKLNRPVSIRIQQSYQAHLDFVGRDQADLAYLGPVTYLHLTEQYGPRPLLAKLEVNGAPFFHWMIITRVDSGIHALKELAGKSFAFGDPNSTMAHIVPRAMLHSAGISVESLGKHDFLTSHHNVALGVLGGYFDAGAVKEEVYYEFEKNGLKMIAQSPPIPEHLFVARSSLPRELVEEIRLLLVTIDQSPDKDIILRSIKADITNLLPVNDRDYDTLRRLVQSLDL